MCPRRAIAAIRAVATTEARLFASEAGVEDAARGEVTPHGPAAIGTDARLGKGEPAHHAVPSISASVLLIVLSGAAGSSLYGPVKFSPEGRVVESVPVLPKRPDL